jgi:hypothetical protein
MALSPMEFPEYRCSFPEFEEKSNENALFYQIGD